jgi:hypothetical protein
MDFFPFVGLFCPAGRKKTYIKEGKYHEQAYISALTLTRGLWYDSRAAIVGGDSAATI